MAKWGRPNSVERLEKMARTLATFARNQKQRLDGGSADAIRDYEADLQILHDTYYVGHFGFGWPRTDI